VPKPQHVKFQLFDVPLQLLSPHQIKPNTPQQGSGKFLVDIAMPFLGLVACRFG
jgi:hypothetical protein